MTITHDFVEFRTVARAIKILEELRAIPADERRLMRETTRRAIEHSPIAAVNALCRMLNILDLSLEEE